MRFRVFIEQDEDGVFVAEVPALPGCVSQGATKAEARANIREAMELHLETFGDEAIDVAADVELSRVRISA